MLLWQLSQLWNPKKQSRRTMPWWLWNLHGTPLIWHLCFGAWNWDFSWCRVLQPGQGCLALGSPLWPHPQSMLGMQECTHVVPQLWLKHGEPEAAWLLWDSLIIRAVGGPFSLQECHPSPTAFSRLWAEGAGCGFAHPACWSWVRGLMWPQMAQLLTKTWQGLERAEKCEAVAEFSLWSSGLQSVHSVCTFSNKESACHAERRISQDKV